MAVTPRSLEDGMGVGIGFQTSQDQRILDPAEMVKSDSKMLMFPCSDVTLNSTTDTSDSDIVTASGNSAGTRKGRSNYTGGWVQAQSPELIGHILRAAFRMAAPTSKALVSITANALNKNLKAKETGEDDGTAVNHPCSVNVSGGTKASGDQYIVGYRKGGSIAASESEVAAGKGKNPGDAILDREKITGSGNYTGKIYWEQVLEITGYSTAPTLTFVPKGHKTKFEIPATLEDFFGLNVQWLRGGVPGVVTNYRPGTVTFSLSDTGASVTVDGIGGRGDEFRTIKGGYTRQVVLPAADYKDGTLEEVAPWSGGLLYGTTLVGNEGIEVEINLNIGAAGGSPGSRVRTRSRSSGSRQIRCTPTVNLEAPTELTDAFVADWQQRFRTGSKEKLTQESINYLPDSNIQSIKIIFPAAEVVEDPQISVPTFPVVFEAKVPDAGGSPIIVETITREPYSS